MEEQALVEGVHAELLKLRRSKPVPGTFAQLPMLLSFLGNGDPIAASMNLGHIYRLYKNTSRELEAALRSLGAGGGMGDNVLERLVEFGVTYDVDQRTARRWSDAGLLSLAHMIVHRDHIAIPILEVSVLERPEYEHLFLRVYTHIPPHARMRDVFGFQEIDGDLQRLPVAERLIEEDEPRNPGWTVFMTKPVIPLRRTPPNVHLDLTWQGTLYPAYCLDSELHSPHIHSRLLAGQHSAEIYISLPSEQSE